MNGIAEANDWDEKIQEGFALAASFRNADAESMFSETKRDRKLDKIRRGLAGLASWVASYGTEEFSDRSGGFYAKMLHAKPDGELGYLRLQADIEQKLAPISSREVEFVVRDCYQLCRGFLHFCNGDRDTYLPVLREIANEGSTLYLRGRAYLMLAADLQLNRIERKLKEEYLTKSQAFLFPSKTETTDQADENLRKLDIDEIDGISSETALEMDFDARKRGVLREEQKIPSLPLDKFLRDRYGNDDAAGKDSQVSAVARRFEQVGKMIASDGELTTALTSDDWKLAKDIAALGENAMREIEITERFNKACQVIDDLKPGEKVTPKRLTKFFAKKHKAAKTHLKRTEGEVLPDDKKRELVELVDAFRAIGGLVSFEDQTCYLDLNKTKSMKQFRFRIRSTEGNNNQLWAGVKVPLLKFSRI